MPKQPASKHGAPPTPRPTADPAPEQLRALFERSNLRLDAGQLQRFWKLHTLLRARNVDGDLTRLHSFESMVLKLYVDSALVAGLCDLPSPLLDLGTGAGFPGIPLKIMRPDVFVLLAEARQKRVAFLREAIVALGLTDIDIVPHRIGKHFDRHVGGIITRAVEPIGDTLRRVGTWLPAGRHILFMKGPNAQPELDAALAAHGGSFRTVLDRAYSIPHTPHARRLIVLERSATPPREYAHCRDIHSDDNDKLKMLRSLHSSRGIRKEGLALMGGARHVHETLRDFPERCVAWITSDTPAPPDIAPRDIAWYRLAPRLFETVDTIGAGPPLLLLQVPKFETWTNDSGPAGCTLFVPFQDPENVGAVIRSAAAFGVARIVLLREAAHPFHPRSLRAAGGSAVFRLPLLQGPSIDALETCRAALLTLGTAGRDIGEFDFPSSFGLLPGVEGPGLPAAHRSAETLHVPVLPGTESLNAATATAIALYLWRWRTPATNK